MSEEKLPEEELAGYRERLIGKVMLFIRYDQFGERHIKRGKLQSMGYLPLSPKHGLYIILNSKHYYNVKIRELHIDDRRG